jgi:dihydromethanopterin reductase (acceptor)
VKNWLTELVLAWAITGGGHFLKETFEVFQKIKALKPNLKVTAYLSKAGREVVRIYGLNQALKEICPGGYLEEILFSREEAFPKAGRFHLGVYKALIVAPATTNTVAKIVHGVADTLVTEAVSQAQKAGVPVYILPTDVNPEGAETTLPYTVDREKCLGCKPCPPAEKCPYKAIIVEKGKARIMLEKCWGCGVCILLCPYEAISFGRKIHVKMRWIDVLNLQELKRMEDVRVIENPIQLEEEILKIL